MTAYITATGRYLPGDPVTNNEIEDYIGKAGRASADLKDLILANCGITTRHYAIDKNQQTVISNAAMGWSPAQPMPRCGAAGGKSTIKRGASRVHWPMPASDPVMPSRCWPATRPMSPRSPRRCGCAAPR
jgi:hypothetical protein